VQFPRFALRPFGGFDADCESTAPANLLLRIFPYSGAIIDLVSGDYNLANIHTVETLFLFHMFERFSAFNLLF